MRVLRKREELIIMTKQRQIVHRINDLSHSKKGKCVLNLPQTINVTKTSTDSHLRFSLSIVTCFKVQGTRRIIIL
jgi:hypothetical protein